MQDHFNLIYREEEREMLPLCREEKIGSIPYRACMQSRIFVSLALVFAPLYEVARGKLTRFWSAGVRFQ